MATTEAMEPTPEVVDGDGAMSMSDAMDVLDEYGIKPEDFDRVRAAIDMVAGGGAKAPAPAQDDQAMLETLFASGRQR